MSTECECCTVNTQQSGIFLFYKLPLTERVAPIYLVLVKVVLRSGFTSSTCYSTNILYVVRVASIQRNTHRTTGGGETF